MNSNLLESIDKKISALESANAFNIKEKARDVIAELRKAIAEQVSLNVTLCEGLLIIREKSDRQEIINQRISVLLKGHLKLD